MKHKNRIKELRVVKAELIDVNEFNFQVHSPEQKRVMREALERTGWADALLVYETDNGRYKLIDGELRHDMDDEVPVLVLDVDENDALSILAEHDPIAAMATQDTEKMQQLIEEVDESSNELLRSMVGFGRSAPDAKNNQTQIETMELKPYEHYDYVIVLARTITEFNQLVDLLQLEKKAKEKSQNKVGLCRAIPATKLIAMLTGQTLKPDDQFAGDDEKLRKLMTDGNRNPESKAITEHAADAESDSGRKGSRRSQRKD